MLLFRCKSEHCWFCCHFVWAVKSPRAGVEDIRAVAFWADFSPLIISVKLTPKQGCSLNSSCIMVVYVSTRNSEHNSGRWSLYILHTMHRSLIYHSHVYTGLLSHIKYKPVCYCWCLLVWHAGERVSLSLWTNQAIIVSGYRLNQHKGGLHW